MDTLLKQDEAEQFLSSLVSDTKTISEIDEDILSDGFVLRQNEKIIKAADKLLIERLECDDGSLRITDIVSAKDSAFKLSRAILGKDDEGPALIPSIINIQIINN